ncbi:MAG: hypothetical protein A2909_01795 [Candidatus Tagabacteria bacterium RIFCSPLOWO2_01_FULL_39_11]|uniref:Kinase inhibitor n=1 Tax=Candidatus Tagabacteria bacterium RIFCSPLOWO2_01_FULL_39_11 TaxID=1802295 RepID=A0A1G2LP63_9BACT|nr:MAG: hypothetical protein A2909_01795 [Candidatus Tagabacteria bacterium RIFCSPLOWO2_01_FULL_39_11]
MKILSSAFEHNSMIPAKYTCDGENINPSLKISSVPKDAKSLVLIVDDPDATRGYTWLHWTVWNIDPLTKEIEENSVPEKGVEGITDFGESGWGGPCPPASPNQGEPSGSHRYFFKLYALDNVLELPPGTPLSEVQRMMNSHILDQTELIGLYSRKKSGGEI